MSLTIEWRHRIQNWQKVIQKLIIQPVLSLDLEGFTTIEQLTLSEALAREFHAMPSGTKWGKKWEYAWFKGSVVVPAEGEGKRLVLCLGPGGESLVWVDGIIAGSVDREHTAIALANPAVTGAVYTFVIEAYAGHGRIYTGVLGPVLSRDGRGGVP